MLYINAYCTVDVSIQYMGINITLHGWTCHVNDTYILLIPGIVIKRILKASVQQHICKGQINN